MAHYEPVGEYTHPTYVGIARCKHDQLLTSEADRNSTFAIDLHVARERVQASGPVVVDIAIQGFKDGGEISISVQQSLEHCLGIIASGGCPSYPTT